MVVLVMGLALLAAFLLALPGRSKAPSDRNTTFVAVGSSTVVTAGLAGGRGNRPGGAGTDSEQSGSGAAGHAIDAPGVPGDGSHRPTEPDGLHFYVHVGRVSGLYPGKHHQLTVVFRNPLPVGLLLRKATTRATGPAACPLPASLVLRTRTFHHNPLIPARGTLRKTLPFGMRRSAPDGCQNAQFTVYVSATAVVA